MECDERRDGDGCGLAKGEKVLKGETRGGAGRMGTISRPDHPPLSPGQSSTAWGSFSGATRCTLSSGAVKLDRPCPPFPCCPLPWQSTVFPGVR